MKKLILLPTVLLFLFAATATAAIPAFNTTTQFKALQSYVNTTLYNAKSTPVTTEQRNAYTAELGVKRNNASARAASLLVSRKKQAVNKLRGQKTRIKNQVNANAKKQQAQALATYKRYSQEEKEAYQAEVTRISLQYDATISFWNGKIRKYNRKMDKTTNPAAVVKLENLILKASNKKKAAVKKRKQAKNAAQRAYDQQRADEYAAYQQRLARIKARKQSALKTRYQQATATYNQRIASAEQKKIANDNTVENLFQRGTQYIADMPPVVT